MYAFVVSTIERCEALSCSIVMSADGSDVGTPKAATDVFALFVLAMALFKRNDFILTLVL